MRTKQGSFLWHRHLEQLREATQATPCSEKETEDQPNDSFSSADSEEPYAIITDDVSSRELSSPEQSSPELSGPQHLELSSPQHENVSNSLAHPQPELSRRYLSRHRIPPDRLM